MLIPLNRKSRFTLQLLAASFGLLTSVSAQALYLDGEGHYALRGEIRTAPGMAKDRGRFEAIDQSFRLQGEARLNDQSSFFLELRLFDDPYQAYLGDTVRPYECAAGYGEACEGAHQNEREPAYKPYAPRVTQAYARYASDYCILEAGRRARQWGMGVFLDDGKAPFAAQPSVFDGVACDINIQKAQTLGIRFGYDKLAETGTYIRAEQADAHTRFGATNPHDDINQFYLTIEYDDRKANAGSSFTKQIGIYGARVSSAPVNKGGSGTDLSFIDLYTSLYFQNFVFQNEFLLTIGKTADPNMAKLGGALYDRGEAAINRVNNIALAGKVEWTIASSGGHIGPAVYQQGDAQRHVAFFNYAYAPGDSDGYFHDRALSGEGELNIAKRSRDAKAVAFHTNFKPALLMFNGRAEESDLAVDGAFDPRRLMNAQVYSLGYRYESLALGNFEAKAVYGLLNQGTPTEVQTYYQNRAELERPIGFYGHSLGTELDLSYTRHLSHDLDLGAAIGALFPGEAWKRRSGTEPANSYLGQVSVAFHF